VTAPDRAAEIAELLAGAGETVLALGRIVPGSGVGYAGGL
jgi:hypothetical protein